MRVLRICALACATALVATSAWAQDVTGALGATGAATTSAECPGNPNALGVSRVVEIDTTRRSGLRLRAVQDL